jgi:hypothetical protein
MSACPTRSRRRPFLALGVGSLLTFGSVGCKDPMDEGKRVPVIGRVTFTDGRPLHRGYVIFSPDAAKGNKSRHEPRGVIDAEGNYKVMTTPEKEGVLPGPYKVTIVAQDPYDENRPYWEPPWLINRRYGNREKSGLTKDVVENPAPGYYDFKVSK